MMKAKIISLCALVLLVISGCSSMKPTDLINAVILTNNFDKIEVAYGKNVRQKLDVYLPKTKEIKTPIVFVYGGAWRDGKKEDYKFLGQALVGLGHPVIIPDYRLFPEVEFPDFIDDVADAIAFTEKDALQLLKKPMKTFVLMGHSSGAHAAALITTNKQYLETRQTKAKITGLIAIAGPYDLDLKNEEVAPVFSNATLEQTNPVLNVNSDMPATLLLHGLEDDRVFPFHTERFEKALLLKNVKVTAHLYEGVNHTKIIGSLAAPLRFLNNSFDDIKDFLKGID